MIVKHLLKLTPVFLQIFEKSLKDFIVGGLESFHHNDGFVKYRGSDHQSVEEYITTGFCWPPL